jgi:N-methylhydantoinase A
MREIEWGTANPSTAFKGTRKVYFEEAGEFIDCNTYERSRLKANNLVAGPAIVEQMDTTTVLPPSVTAEVDKYGTLIVELATPGADGDVPGEVRK